MMYEIMKSNIMAVGLVVVKGLKMIDQEICLLKIVVVDLRAGRDLLAVIVAPTIGSKNLERVTGAPSNQFKCMWVALLAK